MLRSSQTELLRPTVRGGSPQFHLCSYLEADGCAGARPPRSLSSRRGGALRFVQEEAAVSCTEGEQGAARLPSEGKCRVQSSALLCGDSRSL